MFRDFQNITLFQITVSEIILNLSVALALGLFISFIYRRTYKGPGYAVSFVNSIILLAMITAVVIMVIGNNLARAFGLVGAMSIIRFRTAVKETQDIVYIFFSLAIGMAAGVGYHKLAIIGTVFIGLILYVLSRFTIASPKQEEFLLQFSYMPNGNYLPSYLPVLKKYCKKHKVINVKSLGEQDLLEVSYYVKFRNTQENTDFIRELGNTEGVGNINLFFDDEQF